ncbi:MAG: hypothetical protein GXO76_15680 [Calditrichaeota bacterium]|nr:hypothetical protein [Calditrichota bacterium]
MRKILFIFISLFAVSGFIFADAVIVEFHATPGFNRVELTWRVSQETNVKGYVVERRTDNQPYMPLELVKATSAIATPANPKTYTFVDRSIFKPTGKTFYYRLGIKETDREGVVSYSTEVTVSPQISGVHHTWGSIKAMFR